MARYVCVLQAGIVLGAADQKCMAAKVVPRWAREREREDRTSAVPFVVVVVVGHLVCCGFVFIFNI